MIAGLLVLAALLLAWWAADVAYRRLTDWLGSIELHDLDTDEDEVLG